MPTRPRCCAPAWATDSYSGSVFEQLPLRDIHLPDPVSWWPPAPGWWLLAAVTVLLGVAAWKLAAVVRRGLARRRLRRQALEELRRIQRDLETRGNAARTMEHLSVLLRRVAVTVFSDHGVAGLAGRAWVDWLARTGPAGLDGGPLAALAEAPYRRAPDTPARPVIDAAGRWIRHVTKRRS